MKKNVNRAFMLVETLIVTTFIFTFLMIIYIQLRSINNSYSKSFTYNMPNSLYNANEVKEYLNNIGTSDLETALTGQYYVDFTSCSTTYVNDITYCSDLVAKSGISKVLFTKEDLTDLTEILGTNRIFDEELNLYIEYIKFEGVAGEYRIIVQYNDGTFASLAL